MKRIALSLFVVSLAAIARGQSTNVPARTDYVSFRLISDRNIFNPNRSSRSGRNYTRDTERERPVRVERFALLGTMIYEKGTFAFFDGSSADYRKVLKPDDSIAGYRIADVAPTCVKLASTNGQTLELCVGMQMKRRGEEDWGLGGKAESSDNTKSQPTRVASESSASPGEPGDVLKRLMERRQQEGSGNVSQRSETADTPAARPSETKKESTSSAEADDVLKRLLQKREQELNK